jgi:hypothetical protein
MLRSTQSIASLFLFGALHAIGFGQQPVVPDPQPAHVAGTVTDTNGDLIPGAIIVIETPSQSPHSAVANDNGFFQIDNLTPGVGYQVTVSANGFADWESQEIVLSPGRRRPAAPRNRCR